jgi:NAD dependent epimerase/dehydratase family enzyme
MRCRPSITRWLTTVSRVRSIVTAPEPLSNRDFTRTLARVLSRPALFAVPESALRLALGDMAGSTILSSIRAVPARLLQAGYRFSHPDLESALRHVLQKDRRDNFPP